MRRLSLALCVLALAACPGPSSSTSDATTTDLPTTTGTTDPTTGGSAALQRCTPTCRVDPDCFIAGADIGFACVAGVCRQPPCVDDLSCRLTFSGWTKPCLGVADCDAGEACIDIGGAGRCALLVPVGFTCADLGLAELERPALPGARPVPVCGNDDATCSDETCTDPCSSDADCPAEFGHPHCDVATGACTCNADLECESTGKPGLSACLAGRCGCQLDADCLGGTNVDTCVDGACGCSSAATCSDPVFDHVDQVCQPA